MAPYKYLIFHLVKHNDAFYAQTPEEEAKSQEAINNFFKDWYPKVKQTIGSHTMNMAGEWDWMGVFSVNELSDWEAFREDYKRRFPGRVTKSLSMPGVSHTEFARATKDIPHYVKLRQLGQYPGEAENIE